jgi:hypothetical protein
MKRLRKHSLVILTLTIIFQSYAFACNYKNNGDGTLTDLKTDLTWQTHKAVGSAGADWYEAMKIAKDDRLLEKSDWRLPTNDELTRYMASGCWNGASKYYWSATTSDPQGFIAYMEENRLSHAHGMRGSSASAVLVRGGLPADQAEFDKQFAAKVAPLLKQKEQAKQEAVTRAKEAVIAEALARKSAEEAEAKFQNALNSRNPQQMYLTAVKYENDGERSRAKGVYLAIMDKFSTGPFAMKAADRLVSLKDVEAVENSNAASREASREAAYSVNRQNAEQCEKNRSACFSGCGIHKDYSRRSACESGCALCAK